MSLDVLRVWGEKTLDINKGVKYSHVLDPSLSMEVKYPSLTILLVIGCRYIVEEGEVHSL